MLMLRIVINCHIFPYIETAACCPLQAVTGSFPFQAARELLHWGIAAGHAADHSVFMRRIIVQLTTRREYRSITIARYPVSRVQRCVISVPQAWLGAVGEKWWFNTFSFTGNWCLLLVVILNLHFCLTFRVKFKVISERSC